MNSFHTPVLLKEVTELLKVKTGKKYIDATLGGGGHTRELIDRGAIVLAIDVDEEAVGFVRSTYKNPNLAVIRGNFKDLEQIAQSEGFEIVSGILFDLGVSSHQIDSPERGFSFLNDGPLDMRMDKNSQITAEVLVNLLKKGDLGEIFNNLGEEHRFRSISKSIVSARRIKAVKSTQELVNLIAIAYGIKKESLSDFTKNLIAKRVFQALRISVNNELKNITQALPQALNILESKGRIAAISFHSLEDRIVKKSFMQFEKENKGKVITDKPIVPSVSEAGINPRAKSAKLRVFEKN